MLVSTSFHSYVAFSIFLFAALSANSSAQQVMNLRIDGDSGAFNVRVEKLEFGQQIVISHPPQQTNGVLKYESSGFINATVQYAGKTKHLFTVWQPGVALSVAIFELNEKTGRAKLVFEAPTEANPDFIDIGNSQVLILYSGWTYEGDLKVPKVADFYQWNGSSYRSIASVPYKRRFEKLAQLNR